MMVLGTTIHAWGAVTPGMHDIGKLISFIKTCRPAHRRWKAVKVLVIDEGETLSHKKPRRTSADKFPSVYGRWPTLRHTGCFGNGAAQEAGQAFWRYSSKWLFHNLLSISRSLTAI